MERNRVLSYGDGNITPQQCVNTALSSKKVAESLILLFLEDSGHLDINLTFNAVINAVCQISVKCSPTPEHHAELTAKIVQGIKELTEMQINDWDDTKTTVEQSAQMSYVALVNMSFDYQNAQN